MIAGGNPTAIQESDREIGPGGAKGGCFNEEFYPVGRSQTVFLRILDQVNTKNVNM